VSRERGSSTLAGRLRRMLLAVGLLQLLVVGGALLVLQDMRAQQAALTGDYFSTIQDSHAGFVAFLAVDKAAASYLRSGDDDDLRRLREAQEPREDAVDADVLRQRLGDAPAALAALDATAQSARTWFAETESLVEAVEAGGTAAVPEERLIARRAAFEDVQRLYDSYIAAVLDARNDAAGRLDRTTALLFAAVLMAVATSVVVGLALFTALRRWVTAPLDRLGRETQTVRSGELDHRVAVDGPPEIVALADDVEAMRRGLVEQLAAVELAQQQLREQAEELHRSNRDLEQFAYVASHDLQEPLRKVTSFCQMLERRYKGQLDERADQYIAFAVDGAQRMQLLINDLLAFSRVGRLSDGFAEVAMDDVLAEALRNLSTTLEEAGAVVTADPLPTVHGERRLLVQLLQNLLANAVKFRGPDPPRVRVEARRDGDRWELAVSDNGIGVDPRYAERIFVIFQRLHAKSEYEGTGIGLALCKKIVEYHGGSIWLDQGDGVGATFRWTLPVDAPPQEAPSGAEEPASEDAHREAAWSAT
jgi:signal transduction histidine kinase